MENIIKFENVSKSFGDLQVLNNLNMEVKDGEKLALIGPSGSGKTTILRILMTLETIDDGFVSVNDEYLWHEKSDGKIIPASENHLHKMRDHIGMVFQQFNLFPHLTAIENVKQPQTLIKKKSEAEAKEKAEELLRYVRDLRRESTSPLKNDLKGLVDKIGDDLGDALDNEEIKFFYDTTFWRKYVDEILKLSEKPAPRFADGGLV